MSGGSSKRPGEKPAPAAVDVDYVHTVVTSLEAVLEAHEAKRRREDAEHKLAEGRREALTSRVSLATLALTLLVSLVGTVRAERDSAVAAHNAEASRLQSAQEARWAHYQTRAAARTSIVAADEALQRETQSLGDADPRVALAEVQHTANVARVEAINTQNEGVFLDLQELRRRQLLEQRQAASCARQVLRYDAGTRVLTTAILLLSVTLLARREALFWGSVLLAAAGSALAASGYLVR